MPFSIAVIITPAQANRSWQKLPPQQNPIHGKVSQTNQSINGELRIPAGGVGKLVQELNLSRDQIQRLQKLQKNSRGQQMQRRQALQKAKQELNQSIQETTASSDLIRQKRQQVQSLQREIADSNFENSLAIREILTPEQRVKLQQILEQRRQNRLNSQ